MNLVAERWLPFTSSVAARFTLQRDRFTLDALNWTTDGIELTAVASTSSFTEPAWQFRYDGRLNLAALRTILRKPRTPLGQVHFNGEGTWAKGELDVRGGYEASNVALEYDWFTASGLWSRASYRGTRQRLEFPDFEARVLGGRITGRIDLEFTGQKFRAQTRLQGMSLAALLDATDHQGFPTAALHWDGVVDAESLTTWVRDFKSVDSRGRMRWSPPLEAREGLLPATARLDYHYSLDGRSVELRDSEISTPSGLAHVNGKLGATGSALDLRFRTDDLVPWNDFIYRLRGPEAERVPISGAAEFTGRMDGRLDHPTFAGRARASHAAYGNLLWDAVEGDLTYSPTELRFTRASARRGRATAQFDLRLELDRWAFRDTSQWSANGELVRAPLDGLQQLFGTSYPVEGLLTGQFRGSGTRAAPELTGLVDVVAVKAWGYELDRTRGRITVSNQRVEVSNGELHRAKGRITGDFAYDFTTKHTDFDLTGAVIPLEEIRQIQTAALPIGGELNFQIRGGGPLAAPTADGTMRIVNLRVGRETIGSFDARLHSENRRLHAELNSAMADASLRGQLDLTLAGDYPFTGTAVIERLDLDPLVMAALKLQHSDLTGHSRMSGEFAFSGFLARPETITVEANITQFGLNYQFVQLENEGPLRFTYSAEEIRVAQAHIRGLDTDFTLSGFARLAGDRRLNLDLAGHFNLQLLGGFFPGLDARGRTDVNLAIEGTPAQPSVQGRMRVENASATFREFPTGLSRVTGTLVFNESRLLLENVTAEAGGGRLRLGGSLIYGDGPARYDLTIAAGQTRIRYPVGMSWLLNGNLRLTGNVTSALLSGSVQIERLLLTEGFDFLALAGVGRAAGDAPATSSPYLRNLQFDIAATSVPGARIQWGKAPFEAEARLRVRGTWEHPILFGNVRLFGGEVAFRGNTYRVTRGEIVFSDPVKLDPVLNIEAVTTVQQYEVTLSLSGKASQLKLAYRSDPPLPPADVVALLALGRTGTEELRTAGAAEGAGAQAILYEALSSQVGGRIERLFGFSRFRVEPTTVGTGSEQNATARITIQEALTRDLIVTYITNVSSNQRQVIQIEYIVDREISALALLDHNGTFGIDFKIKKRFK